MQVVQLSVFAKLRPKLAIFRLLTVIGAFVLGYYFTDLIYFNSHSLLPISHTHELNLYFILAHFVQILSGLVTATIVYIWLPSLFLTIKRALSNFITQIVFQTLTEFFKEQGRRREEAFRQKKLDDDKKRLEACNLKVKSVTTAFSSLVDTSVLIDGRILHIAKSGFWPGTLIIPQFVLEELQKVADSSEKGKRERGRFGLDIVSELKKLKSPKVVIFTNEEVGNGQNHSNGNGGAVDAKLIVLAKKLAVRLVTVDFNLNKLATVDGVTVLNINELAGGLRTILLPGEQLTVKITSVGTDATQGVAYLPDGTMVVVERAGELLGQDVSIEIKRVLQTNAGKMFFAKTV